MLNFLFRRFGVGFVKLPQFFWCYFPFFRGNRNSRKVFGLGLCDRDREFRFQRFGSFRSFGDPFLLHCFLQG